MSDVLLSERRGRVLVLTLNRPDQRNALNSELSDALKDALEQLDADAELTAGVLTANGKNFCAGMDLKEFATKGPPMAMGAIYNHPWQKPLIGGVHGPVLAGGLELALVCDLLVAAEGSTFGVPEVKRGLLAAGGALLRLPARLPYAVAMEMSLTGDPISAEEAKQYGLVSKVVPQEQVLDEAVALAERIAANAPLSIAASKQMIRNSAGRTEEEGWAEQGPLAGKIFSSKDSIEGSVAFAEKRTPNWSGE
ncbi:MAG TPA: crotonase/enoyl-CoA hydratase family protein [Acidimicrobiales bacterium]|nr:crotonase/enoyl-CoA hydratase family protein [Acidimicrobiales bacterium]